MFVGYECSTHPRGLATHAFRELTNSPSLPQSLQVRLFTNFQMVTLSATIDSQRSAVRFGMWHMRRSFMLRIQPALWWLRDERLRCPILDLMIQFSFHYRAA